MIVMFPALFHAYGVMLVDTSINIQPISPSQIVNAANAVSQNAVDFGRGIAAPLASIGLVIAGIVLLLGIGLAMAKITKSVLMWGIGTLFGVIIMLVFLNHPQEIIGLIYGIMNAFFSHL
jgi:hypothetical protein